MKYWIEVTENREGDDCRFTAHIGTLSGNSTFGGWTCPQRPQGMTREETFAAAAALVQGWLADQDANEQIAENTRAMYEEER